MNIFFLDEDPKKCAEYHVNKHVIKMILESAQLISTNYSVLTGERGCYANTHINHPCRIWLSESLDNVLWLYELTKYLNAEYKYRFNRVTNHRAFDVLNSFLFSNNRLAKIADRLPDSDFTEPKLAVPDDCKLDNPIDSYRLYYCKYKRHLFDWGIRGEPHWISEDKYK